MEYLKLVDEVLVGAGGPGFDVDRMRSATLDNLDAYLPPQGGTWLARDTEANLVGTLFLKMVGPEKAEIKRLYVHPSARNQGVSKRLVLGAMDAARELGAHSLVLDTLAALRPARALYEGLGFEYVDPYPESENDPSLRPWIVFMARSL